jgi:hypothetical protein
MKKATNIPVDRAYLALRHEKSRRAGFLRKAKWIEFCEAMLARGYRVSLYEARRTVSKYLTVQCRRRSFKVRFSNHAPVREAAGDCDLFVGLYDFGTTTDQAIEATVAHLGEPVAAT